MMTAYTDFLLQRIIHVRHQQAVQHEAAFMAYKISLRRATLPMSTRLALEVTL